MIPEQEPATPETEAAPLSDNPMAAIAGALIEAADGEGEKPEGEPAGEPNAAIEGEDVPPEEAPEEAPDGEEQKHPQTAEELAEAYGVPFDDFAAAVQVPVIRDGKTEHVSLHEAIHGNQREADYTRKTQETAGFRKQVEAEAQFLASEKQQHYESMAALFNEVGKEVVGEPPSKSLLDENSLDYNPGQYTAQREAFEERGRRFKEAQRKVRNGRRQLSASEQQKMQQYAADEAQKFRSLNPEWADEAKFVAAQKETVKYLKARGYPSERIANVLDAEDALIAWKASMYDKATAQIGNTKKPVPKYKAGSAPLAPNQGKRRAFNTAVTRLAKGDQSREAQVDAFRKFVG
tara:strand:- start:2687 stop:3733 length:1047 start_codon:yes stop_codon:yes gene_type:complete